jgi:hypothetical protein
MRPIFSAAIAAVLVLSACASAPQSVTVAEAKERSREDVRDERQRDRARQMQDEFNRTFGDN